MNKANWNSRVEHHVRGYHLEQFRSDPTYLSEVVTFDRARLGELAGLDVMHLQCHIGTDTLSLARLGANSVSGLDFSAPALAAAAQLASDTDTAIEYVEGEVYDAPRVLGAGRFDLVYTGVGALCWLPDVTRWAWVVATLLRPGGRFFMREGHPVLWSLSEPRDDGLLVIKYPYFESPGLIFREPFSYVEHDEPLSSPVSMGFNHGLAEIVTALLDAGMSLRALDEHRSVPWNALGEAMVEWPGGEFVLRDKPERLALSYTLQAVKTASP